MVMVQWGYKNLMVVIGIFDSSVVNLLISATNQVAIMIL